MTARVRIYGASWSRASRCLWMLEEIGAPYELMPVPNTRDPEYLAVNPNGRVPALVDGEVVLWESLAINLYLARRFPSDLSPRSLAEEGHALKWTLWAQSEWEGFFDRVESLDEVTPLWMDRVVGVLDGALAATGYLMGGRFTVADLNVANMFNGPVSSQLDLTRFESVAKWRAASRARPAAQRLLARIRSEVARSRPTEA